jgi:hypothetical protein
MYIRVNITVTIKSLVFQLAYSSYIFLYKAPLSLFTKVLAHIMIRLILCLFPSVDSVLPKIYSLKAHFLFV